MNLNFCNMSTELWTAISLLSLLLGATLGLVLQRLFSKAGNDLSSSSAHNLAGCLIPVLFAFFTGFIAAKLLPDDPCGGGYTADSMFVPFQVIPLVAAAGGIFFWFKVLRK